MYAERNATDAEPFACQRRDAQLDKEPSVVAKLPTATALLVPSEDAELEERRGRLLAEKDSLLFVSRDASQLAPSNAEAPAAKDKRLSRFATREARQLVHVPLAL
jgi:hypothetical protein